jgi:predicted DsbA family dithiol-disulfide isomerase|tara:strand:- start:14209 stop:14706 length:498 start_codon:yes stop_codon:yes gene_type:complete
LHPETPLEGRLLSDLFKGRESQVADFQRQMTQLTAEQGLPYGHRDKTFNSRLAQEMASWADTQPDGARFHAGLYRAYFVDNLNIGDSEVLVTLAAEAGLDVEQARRVMTERLFSAHVDADWQRARPEGITGVPTFVSAGLAVVGCQPYDMLLRFVKHLRGLENAE